MTRKIPFYWLAKKFAQPAALLKKVGAVAKTGEFVLGHWVEDFEQEFARFVGVRYAIGVNSGTDALLLVLKALNIGPGDEVITAPNSFIASAAAIALSGAKPVFVDVSGDYNLNPDLLAHAITKRTRVIIPVHLTGNPARMDEVLAIAARHKLFVLEDAAQAVGARYRGKMVGSFGTAGAFSLHPLKNLNVWGDGGVITTNDRKLYDRVMRLRNHGKEKKVFKEFGYNSRLDSVQALIASELLKGLYSVIKQRRKNAEYYDRELASLAGLVHIPIRTEPSGHTFSFYMIRAQKRDALKKYLTRRGIETLIHYATPIHLTPAAKHLGYRKGSFPIAERHAKTILTLPAHEYLTQEDLQYIVRSIKEFYAKD